MPMKKQALLLFGILLFLIGLTLKINTETSVITQPTVTKPSPITEVDIPSVKIDKPVVHGGFTNGQWILTKDKAQYFIPTNSSDVVVYAHDTTNLFANLRAVKIGSEIDLTLKNGQEVKYQVISGKQVLPTAMSEINPKDSNLLVLFTCDGWLDSKRFVVKAQKILSTPVPGAIQQS